MLLSLAAHTHMLPDLLAISHSCPSYQYLPATAAAAATVSRQLRQRDVTQTVRVLL